LYGVDLFNQGYYWEAHEVWEELWHACGRSGQTGTFLKGLIKLAAAGVKAREGKALGVRDHARRAAELFQQTAGDSGGRDSRYLGLGLEDLIRWSLAVAARPPTRGADSSVQVVFDFILRPSPVESSASGLQPPSQAGKPSDPGGVES
jgi:hypothetical protein